MNPLYLSLQSPPPSAMQKHQVLSVSHPLLCCLWTYRASDGPSTETNKQKSWEIVWISPWSSDKHFRVNQSFWGLLAPDFHSSHYSQQPSSAPSTPSPWPDTKQSLLRFGNFQNIVVRERYFPRLVFFLSYDLWYSVILQCPHGI